jgi:hypothetical protein
MCSPFHTGQLGLDLLHRRQDPIKPRRQRLDDHRLPLRDADRLLQISQGILDDQPVLLAAELQAYGRLVVRMAQQVVGRREVEVQLPDEGGFEGNRLELDDDIAAQSESVGGSVARKLERAWP